MTVTSGDERETAGAGDTWHAWLDVRDGRVWKGARIPGALAVADHELRFTITERRHDKRERAALGRLGDHALGEALGREPLVIRIPLAESELVFPGVPMTGRTGFRAKAPGLPELGFSFLDLGGTTAARPYRLLFRVLSEGSAARERRDAVRAEIERRAGTRA